MAKKRAVDEIVIEKNVPIPSLRGVGASITEALRKCEVGDSFVIPKTLTNIHWMASRVGMKVKTRCENDTHRRVWRIA